MYQSLNLSWWENTIKIKTQYYCLKVRAKSLLKALQAYKHLSLAWCLEYMCEGSDSPPKLQIWEHMCYMILTKSNRWFTWWYGEVIGKYLFARSLWLRLSMYTWCFKVIGSLTNTPNTWWSANWPRLLWWLQFIFWERRIGWNNLCGLHVYRWILLGFIL